MLGIIESVLLLLLASFAMPAGYILGTYTENEIAGLAEKSHITKFFTVFTVIIESVVIMILFYFGSAAYVPVVLAVMVMNMFLSSLHAAAADDFVKLVGYQFTFIFITEIVSILILLV